MNQKPITNTNIFLDSTFVGKSRYGTPIRFINYSEESRSLWEVMLTLNHNQVTASEFKQTIQTFLFDEESRDNHRFDANPYTNWDITYRFVRTHGEEDFLNLDNWHGCILVQVPDWDLKRKLGSSTYTIPSMSIPIQDYWDYCRDETNLSAAILGNNSDIDE